MKAVLDTKPTSAYDDNLSQHYQFPRRYLTLMQKVVGDWVVLRRPRADKGDLAYFATARVVSISPDPKDESLSYALFSDYLHFDKPVPWRLGNRYFESALRELHITKVGLYMRGRSVRLISEEDFVDLVSKGVTAISETGEPQDGNIVPVDESPRKFESRLVNRVIRDVTFRRSICAAYDFRCAITGIRVLDRNGNAEVQAAHIWPVSTGGPDLIQNGLALASTIHWLFDHHLISISEDYKLLIANDSVPKEMQELLDANGGQIMLPKDPSLWPHEAFLKKHRSLFFQHMN